MLQKMKQISKLLKEVNNQLEYSRSNFLAILNISKTIKSLVEVIDLKIERIQTIELETPFPWDMLWWQCCSCQYDGLVHRSEKNPKIRCRCGAKNWKLKKIQKPWLLGTEEWTHKQGEV